MRCDAMAVSLHVVGNIAKKKKEGNSKDGKGTLKTEAGHILKTGFPFI